MKDTKEVIKVRKKVKMIGFVISLSKKEGYLKKTTAQATVTDNVKEKLESRLHGSER